MNGNSWRLSTCSAWFIWAGFRPGVGEAGRLKGSCGCRTGSTGAGRNQPGICARATPSSPPRRRTRSPRYHLQKRPQKMCAICQDGCWCGWGAVSKSAKEPKLNYTEGRKQLPKPFSWNSTVLVLWFKDKLGFRDSGQKTWITAFMPGNIPPKEATTVCTVSRRVEGGGDKEAFVLNRRQVKRPNRFDSCDPAQASVSSTS